MRPVTFQVARIVRNDLRLGLRELIAEKWRTGFSFFTVLLLLAFLHIVSIGFYVGAKAPPGLVTQTAAWLSAGIIMIIASLNQSLRVMTGKSDLDLLLAAPLSPTAIVFARVAGTTTAALGATVFMALPFLNGATFVFGSRFAWGYVVWLLLALAAAGIGVGATSLAVQATGSTRILVRTQIAATLALAVVGLVFQSRTLLPPEIMATAAGWVRAGLTLPGASLLAMAGQGDRMALIALGCAAAAGTAFAATRLSGSLTSGLREQTGKPSPVAKVHTSPFATQRIRATVRKDLRLITRDGLLLSKVVPFALFALPGCFLAGRGLQAAAPVVLAVYGTFTAVVVSTQLGKISTQEEACWDLVHQSPASPLIQQLAKVEACLIIPMAVGTIAAIATALLGRSGLALVSIATALVCGAGATWVEISDLRPARHADVIKWTGGSNATTPGRLVAAFAFVIMGPLGVGLVGQGKLMAGSGILAGCAICALLTCGLMRPRPIG